MRCTPYPVFLPTAYDDAQHTLEEPHLEEHHRGWFTDCDVELIDENVGICLPSANNEIALLFETLNVTTVIQEMKLTA